MTLQYVYRYLSLNVWGNLPSHVQRAISKLYANIYNRPFTKFIIRPYCKINYKDLSYLDQFQSARGTDNYQSFQDFFTRVYKVKPAISSPYIWPCEGLLCDYGKVDELSEINIKGDLRHIKTIFGAAGQSIPGDYYFANIFLHNNNYHRIHSPVAGIVKSIERIAGDLVLLRPWIYKTDPSLPAMRNERVNVTIEDHNNRQWYLSIVGGPAVGSIVLNSQIAVGHKVEAIDEIGMFLLGSTCCIASPVEAVAEVNSSVYVGQSLK